MRALNLRLREGLKAFPEVVINSPDNAVPEVLNFSENCIKSETMLAHLAQQQVYVSSASACGRGQPSHTRSCGANSAGIKKPSALGGDSDSVIVRIRFPPNRTIACCGRVTLSLKPRDGRRPFPGKGRGAWHRFSRMSHRQATT